MRERTLLPGPLSGKAIKNISGRALLSGERNLTIQFGIVAKRSAFLCSFCSVAHRGGRPPIQDAGRLQPCEALCAVRRIRRASHALMHPLLPPQAAGNFGPHALPRKAGLAIPWNTFNRQCAPDGGKEAAFVSSLIWGALLINLVFHPETFQFFFLSTSWLTPTSRKTAASMTTHRALIWEETP